MRTLPLGRASSYLPVQGPKHATCTEPRDTEAPPSHGKAARVQAAAAAPAVAASAAAREASPRNQTGRPARQRAHTPRGPAVSGWRCTHPSTCRPAALTTAGRILGTSGASAGSIRLDSPGNPPSPHLLLHAAANAQARKIVRQLCIRAVSSSSVKARVCRLKARATLAHRHGRHMLLAAASLRAASHLTRAGPLCCRTRSRAAQLQLLQSVQQP